jgi:hypothetical protein
MTTATTLPAGLASLPDPATDRTGKPVPERIAAVLSIVAILAEYGRHLAETVEHRALWRGFATIAQFFGTASLPVILAHIQRGLMRAVALERMLLRRAARGRDLTIRTRRMDEWRAAEPAAPQAEPAAAPPSAPPPPAQLSPAPPAHPSPSPAAHPSPAQPAQQPASSASGRSGPDAAGRAGAEEPLSFDTLPSMAQLEAEVRRRPIGQSIVEICRDLGVSPSLCDGSFWHRVFMAIHCYRGSLGNVVLEMRRRETRFDKEHWKYPKLALPEQTREGIRRVLGFAIGERPVDPFRPALAPDAPATIAGPIGQVAEAATGPP